MTKTSLLIPLAASIGGLAASPWPMFRHDSQHTGRSQYVGPQTNRTKWVFESPDPGGGRFSATIGPDGTIYAGGYGYLYAIGSNGSLKWRFDVWTPSSPQATSELPYIGSSAAIGSDGTIYVGGFDGIDGHLFAINPDGTQRWKFNTEAMFSSVQSSPAIGPDGTIYFTAGKYLHAISPSGSPIWKVEISPGSLPSLFSGLSPAISSDGTIYIGGGDPFGQIYLYAVSPEGNQKWKFQTELFGSSPVIGLDGTIYFGAGAVGGSYLFAVKSDGSLKWRFRTLVVHGCSSPAVGSDGTIYFGGADGALYAFNENGSLKWQSPFGKFSASPVIDSDGVIYFGIDSDSFYALNPDGSQAWVFKGKVGYTSAAIGSDGTIYISATGGRLYAIGEPPVQTAVFVTTTQTTPTELKQTTSTAEATTTHAALAKTEDATRAMLSSPYVWALGAVVVATAAVFASALRRRRKIEQPKQFALLVCPRCGTRLPQDAVFCDTCGVKVTRSEDEKC